MLAYRHAFHAGNHADVLKHTVLTMLLPYMNRKAKPYRLIDPHAGAGGYSLEGRYAQKKGEFEKGIARLWSRDVLPEAVADYVARVREFNPQGTLEQYPGSPAFAQMLLRAQDQLRLFELHPTDYRILASYLGGVKGAEVKNADGFEGLKGAIPPTSRRGVVLIDPSYEGHGDYARVIATLRDALTRFAEGVYMVWYPQVTKVEAVELRRRLESRAPQGWLHARLTVQVSDSPGLGLPGSRRFLLQPPSTPPHELLK